jgi:2-polyprenyl-3-methyl-5-hydroxy-6-metoxy-1,4-benzoquinol methylase
MDTVLLLDVIEHLEDPAAFIHEISMKFDNIRHLVITAPARQELWTNYDAYNGHFRRYNLAKVKSLCTSEIHLADAGYFNHLLYPVFWIFARFIKNRETVIKAPSGIGIVVHRILSFILRMDYSLFPAHLPGTSVIALFSFRK